jgi:hypothetical protein
MSRRNRKKRRKMKENRELEDSKNIKVLPAKPPVIEEQCTPPKSTSIPYHIPEIRKTK